MEEEARAILKAALSTKSDSSLHFARARRHVTPFGGIELHALSRR
jgi:plasmid stability protein